MKTPLNRMAVQQTRVETPATQIQAGATVTRTENIVVRIRCDRCGHEFYPRRDKVVEGKPKTKCRSCGDWIFVPPVG